MAPDQGRGPLKLSKNNLTIDIFHYPFVVSLWFDRLTTIGFFPNVLSEVEGQAQCERAKCSCYFC